MHYKYVPADTKAAEGKAQPDTVEEWMKEYREALKQLKQKHYLQAEFQFKSGTQKYKSHAEEVMFAIGLAKTYQEMKDQQKLRDAIAAMVKSQENGIGLPTYRPANQPPTMKKTAKESKPI